MNIDYNTILKNPVEFRSNLREEGYGIDIWDLLSLIKYYHSQRDELSRVIHWKNAQSWNREKWTKIEAIWSKGVDKTKMELESILSKFPDHLVPKVQKTPGTMSLAEWKEKRGVSF